MIPDVSGHAMSEEKEIKLNLDYSLTKLKTLNKTSQRSGNAINDAYVCYNCNWIALFYISSVNLRFEFECDRMLDFLPIEMRNGALIHGSSKHG